MHVVIYLDKDDDKTYRDAEMLRDSIKYDGNAKENIKIYTEYED